MEFCNKCGNMYYIMLNKKDNNNITYHCRKCGDENTNLIKDLKNLCVSKTHIINNNTNYNNIINEYTKLDPTLPRTNKIDCPNENCPSNANIENEETKSNKKKDKICKEIAYIRYDHENMKYIYLCCICDTTWKNDDK